MLDISKLLNPNSIAIIGASNNPQKIGGIVVKNIIESGYQGKINPINPNQSSVQGLPSFPNITSLSATPDLAIFAVPSNVLLPLLVEAGEKGVKNILIFSAGFKEAGKEGTALENSLLEISNKYQFNLLGPNCLGFVNNQAKLNATFGKVSNSLGNLRILSQSGAIATSFFDWAEKTQVGLNQFVTLGNKSVLNENHFLEYWSQNKTQEPIGLYLESISAGPEFIKLCQKITVQAPIYIIKPGKTKGAVTAMMSHTGSLAGSNEVLEAALAESGIIRCESLQDFFNLSQYFSWQKAPEGQNLAIVSNAGGPAVISADAVEKYNLKLATLSEKTTQKLTELLPRMAGLHNPVDILGDALADRYKIALEEIVKEETVDCVLVILTPQIMTEIEETAKIIGEISSKYHKPIICSFIGGGQIEAGETILNKYQIPNFDYPELALKTLGLAYQWTKYKKSTIYNQLSTTSYIPTFSISQVEKTLKNQKPGLLGPQITSYFLEQSQINEPSSIVTNDLNTAKEFAVQIGWPVVMKVASDNLLHKSDGGGVATNIDSLEKITKIWATLTPKSPNLQIQKQIAQGQELIIGFKRDDVFGNTLFFGAGGKYVNLLKDKNLAIFPLTEAKLTNIIANSKIYPLLTGYRGEAALDTKKIISLCLKLGFIFEHLTNIKEMEINPVILNESGIYAVDTKIILN